MIYEKISLNGVLVTLGIDGVVYGTPELPEVELSTITAKIGKMVILECNETDEFGLIANSDISFKVRQIAENILTNKKFHHDNL